MTMRLALLGNRTVAGTSDLNPPMISAAFTPDRLQAVLLGDEPDSLKGEPDQQTTSSPTDPTDLAQPTKPIVPANSLSTAAVAAILSSPSTTANNLTANSASNPNHPSPSVLLIERATHENDPWSGHMAFPGGRANPSDQSSFITAARETSEEIGVDITDGASAQRLGRLTDLQGGPRGTGMRLQVTPHVCWWHSALPAVQLNHEVAAVIWVPLADLADSRRRIAYKHHKYPQTSWPGIELDDGRVVWGLTLRMLEDLFNRAGLVLL